MGTITLVIPRLRESAVAEPFKNFINRELVQAAAAQLQRVAPSFDAGHFVALATHELESLELKARAMQVADALEATLPASFHDAAAILEAALAPPADESQPTAGSVSNEGLAGWILWPVGEFIARRGIHTPERGLQALHALTQRFSAEFAIRSYIVAHPALVFRTLAEWVHDPSAHVRRLVSEGSRPRLPWGLQLRSLIADPTPTLPLLEALQDDPSDYVRRSVANHLNDIAKDHPHLVADWLDKHLPDASGERRALLKHASRTLIKRGDPRVLHAWGVGAEFEGSASLTVAPARVAIGERLTLTIALQSSSQRAQSLAIDYAVHHRKADGSTAPKVFKGWVITLAAGEARQLIKRHSMRRITTRRYYAGPHEMDVRINGVVVASAPFMLTD